MRLSRAVPLAVVLAAGAAAPAEAVKAHTPLGPAAAGITVSPQPGTPDAELQTQLSILGAQAKQLSKVTVVGAKSGRHSGRLRDYSTHGGASFIPRRAFTAGEEVG